LSIQITNDPITELKNNNIKLKFTIESLIKLLENKMDTTFLPEYLELLVKNWLSWNQV